MKELERPAVAFVRLSKGILIDDIVSLPIPIRFLFVLIGPYKEDFNYHEIGRSMSTLLADQVSLVLCCFCRLFYIDARNVFLLRNAKCLTKSK